MKASALQVMRYFVTECHVMANKHFRQGEQLEIRFAELSVVPECKPLEGDDRKWEVSLRTKFQPGPEVNAPYYFTLEVVGFFEVNPGCPLEKVKPLICTNGPSVLYGVVRELVREMTGRGPYAQFFLPSVSFAPVPAATESALSQANRLAETPVPAAGASTARKSRMVKKERAPRA